MKPAVKERQCPSCGEGMPRDAGVCPSCQKESEPWQFFEGAWWTQRDGKWFWLDEKRGEWEEGEEDGLDEAIAELEEEETPAGRAREAHELGHEFFQISLPLTTTERTAWGVFTGSTAGQDDFAMRTRNAANHPDVLKSIEAQGWRLEHVGYVFQETGAVSRDKLLSSGQTVSVTGVTVGVYLFRRVQKQEER